MNNEEKFDLSNLRNQGTGGQDVAVHEDYRVIVYPFGRYEIFVKVSANNEFIGIVEVKVNKDFLSYKQKITPKGFHDVEEFYRK